MTTEDFLEAENLNQLKKEILDTLKANPLSFDVKEGFCDLDEKRTISFFVVKESFEPIAQNPRVFATMLQVVLLALGTQEQMEELTKFIKEWSEKNRFFKGLALDSQLESIEHSFLEDSYFLEASLFIKTEERFVCSP